MFKPHRAAQRHRGGRRAALLLVAGGHDLVDAVQRLHAAGQRREQVDDARHGRDDLSEIILVQHDLARRDDLVPRQQTREAQANHLKQLEHDPACRAEQRVRRVEPKSRVAHASQQGIHAVGLLFGQAVGAGDGDHLEHLTDGGLRALHLAAETAVRFADRLAEHSHRDARHGYREQIEPQHARVVQRRDDDRHGHAGDERHDGAETGLHHLLDIFDIAHDFGQQPPGLGLRVVLDGQALQFMHHCAAQFHFHPTGQARAGAGVQPRRQDVLRNKYAADDEVEPELRQIMMLRIGDNVNDVGNDDRRDPRRRMFDSKPERRPKQLAPMAAVQL